MVDEYLVFDMPPEEKEWRSDSSMVDEYGLRT